MITHDKTIFAKLQSSKMGHNALTILDAIHAIKATKGQAMVDFLTDHPILKSSKLYNDLPDEIAEVNTAHISLEESVASILRWSIKNKSWEKYRCRCGGSTYFPT